MCPLRSPQITVTLQPHLEPWLKAVARRLSDDKPGFLLGHMQCHRPGQRDSSPLRAGVRGCLGSCVRQSCPACTCMASWGCRAQSPSGPSSFVCFGLLERKGRGQPPLPGPGMETAWLYGPEAWDGTTTLSHSGEKPASWAPTSQECNKNHKTARTS